MYKIQQRLAAEEEMERLLAECDARIPLLEQAHRESTQSIGISLSSPHPSSSAKTNNSNANVNRSASSVNGVAGVRASTSLAFSSSNSSPLHGGRHNDNSNNADNSHRHTQSALGHHYISTVPGGGGSAGGGSRAVANILPLALTAPSPAADHRNRTPSSVRIVEPTSPSSPHRNTTSSASASSPQPNRHTTINTNTNTKTLLTDGESCRNPMRYQQSVRESTQILRELMKAPTVKDLEMRRWSPIGKGEGKRHQLPSVGIWSASLSKETHDTHHIHHNSNHVNHSVRSQTGPSHSPSSPTLLSASTQSNATASILSSSLVQQQQQHHRQQHGEQTQRHQTQQQQQHENDHSFLPRDVLLLGVGTRGLGPLVGDAMERQREAEQRELYILKHAEKDVLNRSHNPQSSSSRPLSPSSSPSSPLYNNNNNSRSPSPASRLTFAQHKARCEAQRVKQSALARQQRAEEARAREAQQKEVEALLKHKTVNARKERRRQRRQAEERLAREAQRRAEEKAEAAERQEELWEYRDEHVEAELDRVATLRFAVEVSRRRAAEEKVHRIEEAHQVAERQRKALEEKGRLRHAIHEGNKKLLDSVAHSVKRSKSETRPKAILDMRKRKKASHDDILRRAEFDKVMIAQHAYEEKKAARQRRRMILQQSLRNGGVSGGVGGGNGNNGNGNNGLVSMPSSPFSPSIRYSSSFCGGGADSCDPAADDDDDADLGPSPFEEYQKLLERRKGGGGGGGEKVGEGML